MKTIKFTLIALALCGIASLSSCGETENPVTPVTPEPPAAPTGLAVSDITINSAVLTWIGEVTEYEVIIGDGEAKPVTAKTYAATGLTAETEYSWKVRAKEGDLYSDWVDGDDFTTEAEPVIPVPAPTAPEVSEVTYKSAIFTWEGETASYEIKIGDDITESVNGKTFTTDQLDSETEYAWSVRAVDGERTSEWVDGEAFTTDVAPLIIEFAYLASKYYMGTNATAGTSEFWIVPNSFDPNAVGAAATGWQISLDFYSTLVEKGPDGHYDIPEGTYTFVEEGTTPGSINMKGMTRITEFIEGTRTDYPIADGSMTVSGTHDDYTFEGKLTLQDGRKIEFTFTGAVEL
jgi:hypothetical protein